MLESLFLGVFERTVFPISCKLVRQRELVAIENNLYGSRCLATLNMREGDPHFPTQSS
jgi:hypothetical protein